MNPQQVFAGHLAGFLIRILYGVRYTDMSPFRAIRRDSFAQLGMSEETYGWNLEMQMKAARAGLRILEVPVDHRRRKGGESKVSGTLRGTFVASFLFAPLYSGLASRLRLSTFLPWVYGFIGLTLVAFYALLQVAMTAMGQRAVTAVNDVK